ncbi:hypothetical protein [Psychromonas sp. CD1]|uniref:hypothetical protein n=1 Tax=Psychromonas sp. CD1 TaxID=1979839 RepID=UPI0015DA8D1E|nr:hypothetical protein [Psychromonas sp. CD1]
MKKKLKEIDLYSPIKTFFTDLGYQVKGEINNCDIVVKRGKQTIIIELKLNLNITLLLQAISRFSLSDNVYIAIPKQCTLLKKNKIQIKVLLSRLGIGLILVDIQKTISYVEVVLDKSEYSPRKNLNIYFYDF